MLLALLCALTLAGCDLLLNPDNGDPDNDDHLPQIDNTVDLTEHTPTADGDDYYEEGETYYTSKSIDLVTEINGNYRIDRPFTLDKDDENKRIYHNIYFYEEDFFQVLYYKNINDLGQLFASLSDPTDTQYAQEKKSTGGNPLQINIISQGVYNLILDTKTFEIDMVKISDIGDTPVYETIKSCRLKIFSSQDIVSADMTLDNLTNDYCVTTQIPQNASIGFFSESGTSKYNVTIDYNLLDKAIYWSNNNRDSVSVHIGGTYKVYFNAKTYVLRLELQNPDTATYFCQVEWNKNNELTPKSATEPYLFEYDFVAQGTIQDPYIDIPGFYPERGMKYKLTIINDDGYVLSDMYLSEDGTYKMLINLKEFTLTITKIA